MNSIIVMSNVKKSFGKKNAVVNALRGVSLSVEQGEMLAIMGKSGSGKSTLLNIIGGLLTMDEGEYLYNGDRVKKANSNDMLRIRRNEMGFVVQHFALVEDISVYKNVELPLKYQGYSSKERKRMVVKVLEELGIEDKIKSYPQELSGGQRQRVAIARALVKKPNIILADEPTGALDEATGEAVFDIFRQMNDKGITIIVVTHDIGIAKKCDRIIRLKDGLVVSGENENEVY